MTCGEGSTRCRIARQRDGGRATQLPIRSRHQMHPTCQRKNTSASVLCVVFSQVTRGLHGAAAAGSPLSHRIVALGIAGSHTRLDQLHHYNFLLMTINKLMLTDWYFNVPLSWGCATQHLWVCLCSAHLTAMSRVVLMYGVSCTGGQLSQ